MQETAFTDEDLTAYLDGELDAATRARLESALERQSDLRRRLDALGAGGRPFRTSFDSLLEQAPSERLRDMLDQVGQAEPVAPPARASWRPAAVAAVLLSVFLAGAGIDRIAQYGFAHLPPSESGIFGAGESEEWREAVAADLGLFTKAGVASIPAREGKDARELDALAQGLGMALPLEKVTLAGPEVKRADLLQYEGRPLGQILYLDPRHGPMALCILRSEEPTAPLRMEERSGFNVAFWADGVFTYMLIGRNPAEDIRRFADSLIPRLRS